MKSIHTLQSVARIAGVASTAVLASLVAGCVAGQESESLGEAQSEIVYWNPDFFSSISDLNGKQLLAGYPKCALSGLHGNFNHGQSPQWDVKSLFSEAGISGMTLEAHGGAYTDINNQRVWAGNFVGANSNCWDNQSATFVASALWGGISANYSPTKITGLASNRQCFISHLESADNTWDSTSSFVQVKKYTTTDSTHPTTGWYIEGHLNLGGAGYQGWPSASAVCFDFPTAQEFGTYNISSAAGQWATQATFGNYLASCALTKVQGPFTNDSMTTGVWVQIDPNTGYWTLHAYGGQAGTAVCID